MKTQEEIEAKMNGIECPRCLELMELRTESVMRGAGVVTWAFCPSCHYNRCLSPLEVPSSVALATKSKYCLL